MLHQSAKKSCKFDQIGTLLKQLTNTKAKQQLSCLSCRKLRSHKAVDLSGECDSVVSESLRDLLK